VRPRGINPFTHNASPHHLLVPGVLGWPAHEGSPQSTQARKYRAAPSQHCQRQGPHVKSFRPARAKFAGGPMPTFTPQLLTQTRICRTAQANMYRTTWANICTTNLSPCQNIYRAAQAKLYRTPPQDLTQCTQGPDPACPNGQSLLVHIGWFIWVGSYDALQNSVLGVPPKLSLGVPPKLSLVGTPKTQCGVNPKTQFGDTPKTQFGEYSQNSVWGYPQNSVWWVPPKLSFGGYPHSSVCVVPPKLCLGSTPKTQFDGYPQNSLFRVVPA